MEGDECRECKHNESRGGYDVLSASQKQHDLYTVQDRTGMHVVWAGDDWEEGNKEKEG